MKSRSPTQTNYIRTKDVATCCYYTGFSWSIFLPQREDLYLFIRNTHLQPRRWQFLAKILWYPLDDFTFKILFCSIWWKVIRRSSSECCIIDSIRSRFFIKKKKNSIKSSLRCTICTQVYSEELMLKKHIQRHFDGRWVLLLKKMMNNLQWRQIVPFPFTKVPFFNVSSLGKSIAA